MTKYHISKGEAKPCKAKTVENCPVQSQGTHLAVFHGSLEDCKKAIEKDALKRAKVRKLPEFGELGRRDFDLPFTISEEGKLCESDLFSPSVEYIGGRIHIESNDWVIASYGYTNQAGIDDGVLHSSEDLSEGMEENIRTEPGTYVFVPVVERFYPEQDIEDEYGDGYDDDYEDYVGWAILKKR